MSVRRFGRAASVLFAAGLAVSAIVGEARADGSALRPPVTQAETSRALSCSVSSIVPIGADVCVRRNLAHATFCLPQNLLGILYHGVLELAGLVVTTANVNEAKIIVTRVPFGVSLGRFLFIGESRVGEKGVRHEVGHMLQGYIHGPFYLVFEGLASLIQATVSPFIPSFAASYYDRWPEDEADRLGWAACTTP